MLSVWNDMEFVFTGMWDKGVGNDVWVNVVVLLASEDCSFYDGDNGGGSEVSGNEYEQKMKMDLLYYHDLDLICLMVFLMCYYLSIHYHYPILM